MKIKELTNDECRKVLAETRIGRLACAKNNQPYVVPISFVFDDLSQLYAFSTFGRKIDWMRTNPQVCVEVDKIQAQDRWTTVVVFGEYEELTDTQKYAGEREYAYNLLSQRPMWWRPGFASGVHRTSAERSEPIYFRIHVTEMTGHQTMPEKLSENNIRSWWRSRFTG